MGRLGIVASWQGRPRPRAVLRLTAPKGASVNIRVGILIPLMIVPMRMGIGFSALGPVRMHAPGIAVALFVD